MPETGAGSETRSSVVHQFAKRLLNYVTHGAAAVLLVSGVSNSLAARGKKGKNQNDGADQTEQRGGEKRARDNRRDEGQTGDATADGKRNRDRDRSRDDADREAKSRDRDRTRDEEDDRNRDRGSRDEREARSESTVEKAQRNDRNRDDEPDTTTTDDDENARGNAGSGFFDSPLATKARRRSKQFEDGNREDRDAEDGIVVDVDPEGESTYETGSIFFATGPEGIEVVTRNISYTAAPTPTPTPFPRLELPERERLDVFGDRTISPTPTPTAPANGPSAPPPPPPADTGDGAPVQTPPPGDTTGGDNTGDFLS